MKPFKNNICATAIPVITCFFFNILLAIKWFSLKMYWSAARNTIRYLNKFPTLGTHAFKLPSVFQMSYFKQPIKLNVFAKYNEKASHKLFFLQLIINKHFAI